MEKTSTYPDWLGPKPDLEAIFSSTLHVVEGSIGPWDLLIDNSREMVMVKHGWPEQEVFPFARRGDMDGVAFFDKSSGSTKVFVAFGWDLWAWDHRREFANINAWYFKAVEDKIDYEREEEPNPEAEAFIAITDLYCNMVKSSSSREFTYEGLMHFFKAKIAHSEGRLEDALMHIELSMSASKSEGLKLVQKPEE